jgi:hypothetical protein
MGILLWRRPLWYRLFLSGCLALTGLLPMAALRAQADSTAVPRRLEVGIQVGQSWNEVSFRPGRLQNLLIGNALELSLRYYEERLTGFQATLGYVQGGWSEPVDAAGAAYERELDFVSLHILTQFLPLRGAVRPLLLGGPYLSVPVADRENIPAGIAPVPDSYVGQRLPFRINYGVSFGLGLALQLSRVGIQLDGRYQIGMSELIPSGQFNTSTSRRLAWQARAGVYVRLF